MLRIEGRGLPPATHDQAVGSESRSLGLEIISSPQEFLRYLGEGFSVPCLLGFQEAKNGTSPEGKNAGKLFCSALIIFEGFEKCATEQCLDGSNR